MNTAPILFSASYLGEYLIQLPLVGENSPWDVQKTVPIPISTTDLWDLFTSQWVHISSSNRGPTGQMSSISSMKIHVEPWGFHMISPDIWANKGMNMGIDPQKTYETSRNRTRFWLFSARNIFNNHDARQWSSTSQGCFFLYHILSETVHFQRALFQRTVIFNHRTISIRWYPLHQPSINSYGIGFTRKIQEPFICIRKSTVLVDFPLSQSISSWLYYIILYPHHIPIKWRNKIPTVVGLNPTNLDPSRYHVIFPAKPIHWTCYIK